MVIVEKSGEIISAIVGVKLENRPESGGKKLVFPRDCLFAILIAGV
jgi:NAD-dependent DNA ligase